MEQFTLEKYLENPSRKVVTERNKEVRIICTDINCAYPIIAAIKFNDDRETPLSYDINGKCPFYEGNNLFFADEEKKLSEFDYAILSIISDHNSHTDSIEAFAKRSSKKLLDLARKEIRKEQQEKLGTLEMPIDVTEPYYIKGKQDALKDLPKWKKAKKDEELDCHVAIQQDGRVVLSDFVQKDEYYITLDVLKTLPKEE